MSFLRPEFLYGLFAIAIPIIIHLFNFRRHKKLYFSDITRLKTISTHTRKKQKLKHLIVLALRILTIIFIVIALAGPVTKKDGFHTNSDSRIISICVDNSYSMMSEGQNGRLFESARKDALNIVNQNPDNSNFIVLSNKTDATKLRLLDKEAAISTLEEMAISSNSKKLSQLIATRNRILQKNDFSDTDTYLISDFQSNTTDIGNFPVDSIGNYIFLPSTHLNNKNIYVDSCAIVSPELLTGSIVDINIWIQNDSDTDYEKVPVKLIIDDQQKAVAGIDILAQSRKQLVLSFTASNPGWHYGVIEIEDFPITFDDKLNFAFEIVENIKVLIIGENGNNSYLNNFYLSDDVFSVSEMNYKSIDFNKLSNNDLVILNEIPALSTGVLNQLKEYLNDGGNVLYIPPVEEFKDDVSKFMVSMNAGKLINIDTNSTRVSKLKLSSPLFAESITKVPQNAELPTVNKHYSYVFPANSGVETLVSLLSGDDFLSKKNIGSGQLFLLSIGLNNSFGDFTSQLLFSPIMHGIASKRSSNNKLYYTLGETSNINIPIGNLVAGDTPFTLIQPTGNQEIIPGQKYKNNLLSIELTNIDIQNGYYNLTYMDSVINVIAFNFNRSESEMKFMNKEQIEEICSKSGVRNYQVLDISNPNYKEVINGLQKESDFWKLFIIFALFVVLLEVILLRFWK